jgi:hypothetical protein
MPWGGRREGAGRPKGLHGVKSTELAEMLDDMGANPAKALARLGLKAEREGNDDLATRAYAALLPFRYAKLRETSLGIGLLEGSLADRLEAASARLTISVVTGVPRPPDDPIEADPTSSPVSPPAPEPPAPQTSPSPAASPPKPPLEKPTPRPAAPPPSPEPPLQMPGRAMAAHDYWARKREPEVSPVSDYDPWKDPT